MRVSWSKGLGPWVLAGLIVQGSGWACASSTQEERLDVPAASEPAKTVDDKEEEAAVRHLAQLNFLMKETLDLYAAQLAGDPPWEPQAYIVLHTGDIKPLRLQHDDMPHPAYLSMLFRTLTHLRERGLIQAAVVYDRIEAIPDSEAKGPFVLAQLEHHAGMALVRWVPYAVVEEKVHFGDGGQRSVPPVIFSEPVDTTPAVPLRPAEK